MKMQSMFCKQYSSPPTAPTFKKRLIQVLVKLSWGRGYNSVALRNFNSAFLDLNTTSTFTAINCISEGPLYIIINSSRNLTTQVQRSHLKWSTYLTFNIKKSSNVRSNLLNQPVDSSTHHNAHHSLQVTLNKASKQLFSTLYRIVGNFSEVLKFKFTNQHMGDYDAEYSFCQSQYHFTIFYSRQRLPTIRHNTPWVFAQQYEVYIHIHVYTAHKSISIPLR